MYLRHMPEHLLCLRQQSRESSNQQGAEPSEAAKKLRSISSEEIHPGKPPPSSPRSKLQDIAEKGQQSSSAYSPAISQASISRQAVLSVLPVHHSPEEPCAQSGGVKHS